MHIRSDSYQRFIMIGYLVFIVLANRMSEFNEHGMFPIDSTQKDHTRENSKSSTIVTNVVGKLSGKLKPIKVNNRSII